MALEGGAAVDTFVTDGEPTRGLGAILAGGGHQRHALPLARVTIAAAVADRIAEVTITQVFHNACSEPIEAVYTFPLDGGSIVSRFEMQAGERTLHGVVAERADARQRYDRALNEGKRAALLEQERDDVFTIQLGNLPPGEDATIRLTYSEELTFFDDGLTELRLPLVLGVRYVPGDPAPGVSVGHGTESDTEIVRDASRITPPRLAAGFDPGVHLAVTVDLARGPVTDLACSQHATRLGTAGGRTTISLARHDERLDRDFVLRWRAAAPGAIAPTLFFYRRPTGERYGIVSMGAAAGAGEIRPRDVIFVLDRSGSMQGAKIASAARACSLLLGTLGAADRFGLLAFNEGSQWLIGTGSAGSLVTADRTGISRGERVLREVQANGGTELHPALISALAALDSGGDISGRVPILVLITDGQVGDESRVLSLVQRANARVFTVGVDTSVNSGLLKRVAQAGRGTFVMTEPGAGLDSALEAIGREIGAPVVENLAIALEGGRLTDIAPERLPDLFAGRAATIAFRAESGLTAHITGRRADGGAFSLDVTGTEVDLPAVAHLWARRRLMDLEDRYRLARDDKQAIQAEIVALSTSHGVLSRFTAFLVVDDQQAVVSPGERRTIVQPVEMPHMWTPGVSLDSAAPRAALNLPEGVTFGASTRQESSIAKPSVILGRSVSRIPSLSVPRFFSRSRQRQIPPAAPGSAGEATASDTGRIDEVADLLERLLAGLKHRAARAGAPTAAAEALELVERLLALLAARGASEPKERLTAALKVVRERLKHALSAEHELKAAGAQLENVWAELSPAAMSRERFWDAV
jgi:Ca-activated chloride channel homolog